MFRAVAAFELGRQLRGHVFWVVAAISFGMVLGSVGVDQLRVGVHAGGLRNGAEAVVLTHGVWTLFFMFATAAFVADAVLRDASVGFAPIFAAAPIGRFAYLGGRFAGAFLAVLLCFASVPLGILAGAAMPWVAPASVGPPPVAALAWAYGVIALPNLLLSAAVGFALATLSRSLNVALVGAVALLTVYGLGARAGAALPPVLEPFGFAAYARAIAGWPAGARDLLLPALAGVLLANRLLVLAASACLLLLAAVRLPERIGRARRPASAAAPSAQISWPRPSFDRLTVWRQVAARTRLEVGQTVRTPVFAALLLLGVANALATLWPMNAATAGAVARALGAAFQLTPIVTALFFTGELRWLEEERGVARLLDATPLAPAAFLAPKVVAIALVLVGSCLAAAGASALLLAMRGEAGAAASLPVWVAGASYDALTFAALAMFLQALAPGKHAGWGLTVLYLIATLTLDRLGFVDPAYRYGRYPGAEHGFGPYHLGWAVVAALLVVGATALAPRRRTPA